jgi:NADPH2:quinone reductase
LAAIQLAHRAGATVLATASSDDRLARLAPFGLDHGINYRDDDMAAAVRRLTDGRGVDLVVESVGTTLAASVRSLAYRGRISYVGDAGRGSEPFDVGVLKQQNQSITGVFLGAELGAGRRAYDNIERLLGLVATGELQVVIDSTFPLEDAAAAHAHVEARRAFGRVVITP